MNIIGWILLLSFVSGHPFNNYPANVYETKEVCEANLTALIATENVDEKDPDWIMTGVCKPVAIADHAP